MLTMAVEDINELLEKAALVDIVAEDSDLDDENYGALVDAVEALSPEEVHQLLTLDRLGHEESEAETWQDAAAEASSIPEEERLLALVDALVFAEAIEAALATLGYATEEDEEDEESEESEEDEDEEDEEGSGDAAA